MVKIMDIKQLEHQHKEEDKKLIKLFYQHSKFEQEQKIYIQHNNRIHTDIEFLINSTGITAKKNWEKNKLTLEIICEIIQYNTQKSQIFYLIYIFLPETILNTKTFNSYLDIKIPTQTNVNTHLRNRMIDKIYGLRYFFTSRIWYDDNLNKLSFENTIFTNTLFDTLIYYKNMCNKIIRYIKDNCHCNAVFYTYCVSQCKCNIIVPDDLLP